MRAFRWYFAIEACAMAAICCCSGPEGAADEADFTPAVEPAVEPVHAAAARTRPAARMAGTRFHRRLRRRASPRKTAPCSADMIVPRPVMTPMSKQPLTIDASRVERRRKSRFDTQPDDSPCPEVTAPGSPYHVAGGSGERLRVLRVIKRVFT